MSRFNPAGFRQTTTVFVAGWYLLATSGLVFLALPAQTKTVTPDFRCANHSCDCRTAEQCAEHCCCFPVDLAMDPSCPMHADAVAESKPITVTVTAVAVATCAGGADDGTAFPVFRIGPHEASALVASGGAHADARWAVDETRLPSFPDIEGPDKIPISLS
jgi:hypothetical protein